MAFTRTQIKAIIREWVDDRGGMYFDDTALNYFIQLAEYEVQKQLIAAGEMYYEKCQQTTLVVNQWDYILPNDFLKLHRLELVTSGSGVNEERRLLKRVTMNEQDKIGPKAGTPLVYVIKKTRMTLYPTPDAAKTLRLYYSFRITPMANDSDTPDIPEEFQEYIALLAAYDCFIKDDRNPSNLEKKIKVYTDRMKSLAEDRDESESRQVIDMDGEDVGVLL